MFTRNYVGMLPDGVNCFEVGHYLTFNTALCGNSAADDKCMIQFSYFSQKIGFGLRDKIHEISTLVFLGKIRKTF